MKHQSLLAISLIATVLGITETATASSTDAISLDFSFPPANTTTDTAPHQQVNLSLADELDRSTDESLLAATRLTVPTQAAQPPASSLDSVNLEDTTDQSWEALPPPPIHRTDLNPDQSREENAQSIPPIALDFNLTEPNTQSPIQPIVANLGQTFRHTFNQLFIGDSESLVARAVGSAEGTRTASGHRNPAYYGHVDPGNGVWNLGSFSYQHGAESPEVADIKQLDRLQNQTQQLRQQAKAKGLKLSLEEELNGIDLANQAPLAALSDWGYIDWLAEAHQMNLKGADAILWARTRSFLDPDTKRWNAPGLGNTTEGITHDQERRMGAIARAIEVYEQDNYQPNLFATALPNIPLPDPVLLPSGHEPSESVIASEKAELAPEPKPLAFDPPADQVATGFREISQTQSINTPGSQPALIDEAISGSEPEPLNPDITSRDSASRDGDKPTPLNFQASDANNMEEGSEDWIASKIIGFDLDS